MQEISVKDAASQLGMSEQAVRIQMQRRKLPIGVCDRLTGGKYYYRIWQEWIDNYAKYGPKWQCMNLYKEGKDVEQHGESQDSAV